MLLLPATPGTGVIAGGPVRAVLEAAGVHDVLTKALGTSNPINVVRATMQALLELRDPRERRAQLGRSGVSMARGRIAVRWVKSQIGRDRAPARDAARPRAAAPEPARGAGGHARRCAG